MVNRFEGVREYQNGLTGFVLEWRDLGLDCVDTTGLFQDPQLQSFAQARRFKHDEKERHQFQRPVVLRFLSNCQQARDNLQKSVYDQL